MTTERKFSNKTFEKFCKEKIKTFEERVLPMHYISSGIFMMEGFILCSMIDFFDVDVMIESGTAGGKSTEIMARYFKKEIITIDTTDGYGKKLHADTVKRLSKYKNVKCVKGNGVKIVPHKVAKRPNSKIGLFFDGPKGSNAIDLAKRCFKNPLVKFVGIHDQCYEASYHNMDSWDRTVFYTDSNWIIKSYSYLDNDNKDAKHIPNGPGVGFAVQ